MKVKATLAKHSPRKELQSSFYAILKHHKLKDSVLERIARIIDEADTVQEVSVEPAATGLDLICDSSVPTTGRRSNAEH